MMYFCRGIEIFAQFYVANRIITFHPKLPFKKERFRKMYYQMYVFKLERSFMNTDSFNVVFNSECNKIAYFAYL